MPVVSVVSVQPPALSNRLAARAFALAVDPTVPVEAAGAALLQMARGSRSALVRAQRRVEWDLADRPSRLAEAAALALRAAVVSAGAPGVPAGRGASLA